MAHLHIYEQLYMNNYNKESLKTVSRQIGALRVVKEASTTPQEESHHTSPPVVTFVQNRRLRE